MPTFKYKAKQGPDKIVQGAVEAPSWDGAIQEIIRQGFAPIDVVKAEGAAAPRRENVTAAAVPRIRKKVGLLTVALFTRQMSDLLAAAVPMLRALEVVSGQIKDAYFKTVVAQMRDIVHNGGSLADALARYPDVFPPLYVNMVRTGELGGRLQQVLSHLATHLEKEQEVIGKIRSSMAYPLLVLAVGCVTVFVLLSFIIPRLTVMFEDLDQALPVPTVVLMNISAFFARWWWLILAAAILIGGYVSRWLQTSAGRMTFDRFKIRLPVLGEFIRTVEVSRFARTLGTLLASGVSINVALKAVSATASNVVFGEEVEKIASQVSEGASLKGALQKASFFPEMAVNMVSVGEEAGHLEQSLEKVAQTYEWQADQTVKTMLSLLGPLVLIVIVSLVGFALIAMLLPILRMNLLVQ